MKDKSKRILFIVAIVLVIAILAYLVDYEAIINILLSTNLPMITVSILFMIAGFIMVSVRMRLILGGKISLRQTFYGDALGFMTAPFLPIPTPVLRAIGIERMTPLNASMVSPALVVEFLFEFVMRLFSVLMVILLLPSAIESTWSIVGSVLLLILLFGGLIWLVNHLDQAFDTLARWVSYIPMIEEERVRQSLAGVRKTLESAGSTRSLLIGLLYTLVILFCFTFYHYFAWAAFPLDLRGGQMLVLSLAVMVVVPPSAPLMIGAYQGVVVGALILLNIANVNILTAYAILLQVTQIIFWLIAGSFVLMRTRIPLGDLIQRTGEKEGTQ